MRWHLLPISLVAPFVFHAAYQPINESWTVERFGCGCPPLDLSSRFDANDFNLILWIAVFVICGSMLIWSCLKTKSAWRYRLIAMLLPILGLSCAILWVKEIWL